MKQTPQEYFASLKGKRAYFIGAGVSHRELIPRFAREGALVTLCDKKSEAEFGDYARELRALGVEFKLGEGGLEARHIDGLPEATWVVLDYASVIVHIFNSETRNFYNLEKLWNEAEEVDISDYLKKD